VTRELKQIGSTMCVQLLAKPLANEHNNWRNLITRHETLFCQEYVRGRTWTASDDKTEVAHRTITFASNTSVVLGNCHGFHGVTTVPQ
jgi:hypothetical protein